MHPSIAAQMLGVKKPHHEPSELEILARHAQDVETDKFKPPRPKGDMSKKGFWERLFD